MPDKIRVAFLRVELKKLFAFAISLFLRMLPTISVGKVDNRKATSIIALLAIKLRDWRHRLLSSSQISMSKEIIDRLVDRAEPYHTSDRGLAEALEEAGFFPKGTVYRDPSIFPKIDSIAMDTAAKELGYNLNTIKEGKGIVDRLTARLEGQYFLSGTLLMEVKASPDKLLKAQQLGLLPSGGD